MGKATKTRAISVDQDDIKFDALKRLDREIADALASGDPERIADAPVAQEIRAATTLAPVAPVTKPNEQPVDETTINVPEFKKAIKAQFTGSRAVIDHIKSLKLTPESKNDIERLRVVFFDTWPELCYGKMGMTAPEARRAREDLFDTKNADRSENQHKIYGATKSAWLWIKEQSGLKAAPKKREPNSGTGVTGSAEAGASAKDKAIDASKVTTFEDLAQLTIDVAALIDMIATKATQAKIKSAGLIPAMHDVAKAIRLQVAASRDGLK